jgi:hypothetical protein
MALLSLANISAVSGGLWIIYCVALAVYRIYFHPLSRFPGSKLAALSLWYEFYYDVVKRGQYIWKIQEMHKRYGTSPSFSVRISGRRFQNSAEFC